MTRQSIIIRNVYVMLAYAFRSIRNESTDRVAAERFDHIHDLLAEILVRGVGTQVKRGIHRDYVAVQDELSTVRGRIDVTRTIATSSTTRGRLVCEFDEYEHDTLHNRVLKTVMVILIRHSYVSSDRKDALRRLLRHFDSVTLIAPRSIRWNELKYHRATASYRLLLGICELIVRDLLPTREAGKTRLNSWLSDEAMSRLYERFLREYYLAHHPELSPAASEVSWDFDELSAAGTEQLPAMSTDVTLRRGSRMLIIDAKYYKQSMQIGRWGKSTVHSANLYQILAYTKNADTNQDGSVSGLLLYAHTRAPEQPHLDVVIQGNRIGAQSMDLNQPWDTLRDQLENVLNWLN